MNFLRLPLVDTLVNSYSHLCFSKVKVIGVQHILETTHAMFRSLYQLGLKAENVSLIGKCYSSSKEVFEEMIAEGIDVDLASFAYSSHLSFDFLFDTEVKKFLESKMTDLTSDRYDLIIVLDDGEKCIKYLSEKGDISTPMVGIEQTSAGYEAIRFLSLAFPVINVARSPVKLHLESPMIAQAAVTRLQLSLKKRRLHPERALIIGGGAIGQAMRNSLSSTMEVKIYDQNEKLREIDHFEEAIKNFPLIIGCTGKTSLSQKFHPFLSKTTLVSVSSSDREFDAVYLRKQIKENTFCHQDLLINDLLLVNGGFPVNFDGERENIDPSLIQLTIALITAGLFQALCLASTPQRGILPLEEQYEQQIEKEFSIISSQDLQPDFQSF